MAARHEPLGVEVRLTPELSDAGGDAIRVRLLFESVLEELFARDFTADPLGRVVVRLVAKGAHDLRGQRLLQDVDHFANVLAEVTADRALFHVGAGALADLLDIGLEWLQHESGSFFDLGCGRVSARAADSADDWRAGLRALRHPEPPTDRAFGRASGDRHPGSSLLASCSHPPP